MFQGGSLHGWDVTESLRRPLRPENWEARGCHRRPQGTSAGRRSWALGRSAQEPGSGAVAVARLRQQRWGAAPTLGTWGWPGKERPRGDGICAPWVPRSLSHASGNLRRLHPTSLPLTSVTDAVSSFSAFKLSPTTRRKSESCYQERRLFHNSGTCPPCPTSSPPLLSIQHMQTLSLVPNWTGGPARWDGLREPGSAPRSVRCNRSVPMGPGGRGCSRGSSWVGAQYSEVGGRKQKPKSGNPHHTHRQRETMGGL